MKSTEVDSHRKNKAGASESEFGSIGISYTPVGIVDLECTGPGYRLSIPPAGLYTEREATK